MSNQQYDNTNRSQIWGNDKKESDRHPDFKGDINIEGKEYWLSAWKRKPGANPKAPALSFSVQPKEQVHTQGMQQAQQAMQQGAPQPLPEDDIPFQEIRMEKQFEEFKAYVPANFKGLMIQYWMRDENIDRDEAIAAYIDTDFDDLHKRIANTFQTFKPDLGYSDAERNGTLCVEIEENNVVIPVQILEEV